VILLENEEFRVDHPTLRIFTHQYIIAIKQVELAGQIKCARWLGAVTKQISSKLFVYVASFLKYNALARKHQVGLQEEMVERFRRKLYVDTSKEGGQRS